MTAAETLPLRESVLELASLGVEAFTTTRAAGNYGLDDAEPDPESVTRWEALHLALAPRAPRLASARQVHGGKILEHGATWNGWLRTDGADGHCSFSPGIACAVTVADCVPVFIAHPSGVVALLHAGWRGTAARITQHGIQRLTQRGLAPAELRLHLGPAICGRCYVVSPDVFEQLTGWTTARPRNVDLRSLIADQAKELGVKQISMSPYCTRCDNDRFFSHRAGDAGRQVGVIVSPNLDSPL